MCLDFGGTNPTGFILTTVLGTAASEARINQNQSNNQNNPVWNRWAEPQIISGRCDDDLWPACYVKT
jgi:hypothetical protein